MPQKEIDYTSPPVSEVVFGFLLERPTRLLTAHFGAFWSRVREKFPSSEDQPPLVSLGDTLDPSAHLSRVWFISRDGRRLIQLQHDRLYYNWRRLAGDTSPYPEYTNLFAEFSEVVDLFEAFLIEEGLSKSLLAGQFELTYINMLEKPAFWEKSAALGDVLVDHRRCHEHDRFLPSPKDFSWASVYDMPHQSGQMVVEAKSGRKTQNPDEVVIQLTLTAKSNSLTEAENTLRKGFAWFDTAHKQIVCGFADVTDSRVQNDVWGRKK
ncbi:TIGR04255 family protein [Rhodobacter sp. SY28-1]|uniref:TIGR04255 family protein n=1 Tax=Rhodobacter sp. SY28-1 TaxID=2562317 RepID=UPI0014859FC6|nr:TIGR04255 family protein [Rhodobacter sp. SY28-1]